MNVVELAKFNSAASKYNHLRCVTCCNCYHSLVNEWHIVGD